MMKMINKLDQLARLQILEHHPGFKSSADQFIKWLPLLGVATCDVLPLKTRHKLKEQIIIAAMAEVLRKGLVYTLKHTTHHLRPNLSLKRNSFPSGHTATGFMCAEIMRNELKDCNKILATSGYSLAIITGALRLYKNKHWLSDVLAGAVCGWFAAVIARKLVSQLKKRLNKQVENNSSNSQV